MNFSPTPPRFVWGGFAALVLLTLTGYFFVSPPDMSIRNTTVKIEKDLSVSEIGQKLEEEKIIASGKALSLVAILLRVDRSIAYGDYYFAGPENLFKVLRRISNGVYGFTPVSVTIPEGETISGIASILKNALPRFDDKVFLEKAKGKEGYLFPDTYFFYENVTPDDVIEKMGSNFESKIDFLKSNIGIFDEKKLRELIIMASIIENEVRTHKDRKIVSGILWKRLSINMPLQVDAPFLYVIGKNTYELTVNDLRLDSPYNTYRNRGLPPGPIGNPGLEAIIAAIEPLETDYLYYLSDTKGNTYYSKDYAGHLSNKRLYMAN